MLARFDEPWRFDSVASPLIRQHSADWDGQRVLVFGGISPDSGLQSATWSYSPSSAAWSPVNVTDAPPARSGHTSIWTGNALIVFGGTCGAFCFLHDLWAFQPVGISTDEMLQEGAHDKWSNSSKTVIELSSSSPSPAIIATPAGGVGATNSRMIMGNASSQALPHGQWNRIWQTDMLPTPRGRYDHAAAWSDEEGVMFVLGGVLSQTRTLGSILWGFRFSRHLVSRSPGANHQPAPRANVEQLSGQWDCWVAPGQRVASFAGCAEFSSSNQLFPVGRRGHVLRWSRGSLVLYGGRSASLSGSLAVLDDLWVLNWTTHHWERLTPQPPWPDAGLHPASAMAAHALLLLAAASNASSKLSLWVNAINLPIVASSASGASSQNGTSHVEESTSGCRVHHVGAQRDKPLNPVAGKWLELCNGGVQAWAEPPSGQGDGTDYQMLPVAALPSAVVEQRAAVWVNESQTLLLIGGASFSQGNASWRFVDGVWSFQPHKAHSYFNHVRAYERELLRNMTEVIAMQKLPRKLHISEEVAWTISILVLLCCCCCCPLTCLYCQLQHRAKERQREEDLAWTRHIGQEMVMRNQIKGLATQTKPH